MTDIETRSEWGADDELWRTIQPPLVPSPSDLALVRAACPPELMREDSAPRVLVLGVTPALVDLPWPVQAEVHAVDYDQAMIDMLWRPGSGRYCHRARWQEMPFPDGFFDLVVGDCSFNALPGPADYADVLCEVGRVRSPAAPLIVRAFVQSEPRLMLAGLASDAGAAPARFSTVEVRLLIAIAAAEADGTLHFTDIPGRIREEWGEVEDYLAALGHSPADIERTKSLFVLDQRLNYPSERELAERIAPWFGRVEFAYPDYAVGRNCPNMRCYPE